MANKIRVFFEKIGHDVKVVAVAGEHVFTTLFGAQATQELISTAENVVNTEFGKAVIADAQILVQEMSTGKLNAGGAIVSLAQQIYSGAKAAGKSLSQQETTLIASLIMTKLSGSLSAVAAATQPATAIAPATPTHIAAEAPEPSSPPK